MAPIDILFEEDLFDCSSTILISFEESDTSKLSELCGIFDVSSSLISQKIKKEL